MVIGGHTICYQRLIPIGYISERINAFPTDGEIYIFGTDKCVPYGWGNIIYSERINAFPTDGEIYICGTDKCVPYGWGNIYMRNG